MKIDSILYHILFWILLVVSFALSEWGPDRTLDDAITYQILFLPSRLFAVYFNWFILIPKFLNQKKISLYLVILVVLLLVDAIMHRYFTLFWAYPKFLPHWIEGEHFHILKWSRLLQTALIIVIPVLFTTIFKSYDDSFKQKKKTDVLEREKVSTELKFLRSQINPHFLFNTLNSIYGLALEKSEKTPNLILKLSGILRYVLYGSDQVRVPLKSELGLVEDLITLEKERYGERVSIDFKVNGNIHETFIPPLLLLPFVENAFKHGLKNEEGNGWMNILVETSAEVLLFSIENSVSDHEEMETQSGIGLKNVRRRLELLFGKNVELDINKKKDSFYVMLIINFKDA